MERPKRVQLFHTCLINEFYPEVGMSVVAVLRRLGFEVEVPLDQTCCGQPAYNAGFHADAKKAARHTVEVLDATEGPILIPSGSCADMISHQYRVLFQKDRQDDGGGAVLGELQDVLAGVGLDDLEPAVDQRADDEAWLLKVDAVSKRCVEFSQFIADQAGAGGRLNAKIAYHPSCHLLRGLGVDAQPKALLGAIDGVTLVEVKESEECCGFGGAFSVKNPAISGSMMDRKLKCIEAAAPDRLVSCDMGCLMHLSGGLRRKGSPLTVQHLAQVLEEAMK